MSSGRLALGIWVWCSSSVRLVALLLHLQAPKVNNGGVVSSLRQSRDCSQKFLDNAQSPERQMSTLHIYLHMHLSPTSPSPRRRNHPDAIHHRVLLHHHHESARASHPWIARCFCPALSPARLLVCSVSKTLPSAGCKFPTTTISSPLLTPNPPIQTPLRLK